jgi:hypothetical protein
MPEMTKTQQRASNALADMSGVEHEMLATLESVMYVANSAGDPHHWERSTFGAVRTALVTTVQAVVDRTNRNTPPDAARTLAKHVVALMIDNHEDARYNLRLIAQGIR